MEKLVFQQDGVDVTSNTGKLKGLLDARDISIPGVQAKLDTLASDMITKVNAVHATGYGLDNTTGQPFFTGTNAATISLNAVLATNPEKIAASSLTGTVGNSANALAIADLQKTTSAALNGNTFDQFYSTSSPFSVPMLPARTASPAPQASSTTTSKPSDRASPASTSMKKSPT